MTDWFIACPKCLSDQIEEVYEGYYYCTPCTNLWEVVAKAGKPKALPERTSKSGMTEFEKRFSATKRPILNAPEPAQLEPDQGVDFP